METKLFKYTSSTKELLFLGYEVDDMKVLIRSYDGFPCLYEFSRSSDVTLDEMKPSKDVGCYFVNEDAEINLLGISGVPLDSSPRSVHFRRVHLEKPLILQEEACVNTFRNVCSDFKELCEKVASPHPPVVSEVLTKIDAVTTMLNALLYLSGIPQLSAESTRKCLDLCVAAIRESIEIDNPVVVLLKIADVNEIVCVPSNLGVVLPKNPFSNKE